MPSVIEIKSLACTLACAFLLSACAPVPRSSVVAAAPSASPPASAPAAAAVPAVVAAAASAAAVFGPADQAARDLLAFNERLRQMSTADVARELARLGDAPTAPPLVLEFALVLAHLHNPGDAARALGALEPLLRSTAPEAAPWQPWARLLASRLSEQRRLEDQLERQNQQARENQRRLDQLSEKLEALKAIERSLTTRPTPGTAALPPVGAASRSVTP